MERVPVGSPSMEEIAAVLGQFVGVLAAASPGSSSAYTAHPLTTAEDNRRREIGAAAASRWTAGAEPSRRWAAVTTWSSFDSATAHLLTVRRIRYGSPLDVLVGLPTAFAAVPVLVALFYAVKRFYGFDLEIRAHREK